MEIIFELGVMIKDSKFILRHAAFPNIAGVQHFFA